jgi:hypothetical protein
MRTTMPAYFQHDGGTVHTTHVFMPFLYDVFGKKLISRAIWPLRLPDLGSTDFYLWGAMKASVYKDNPRSLRHLKEAITYFIRNIPVLNWNWGSSVSIVSDYRPDNRGSILDRGRGFFF